MAKNGFHFLLILLVLGIVIMSCRLPNLNKAKTMLTELPAIVTQMASTIPDLETLIPKETPKPIITTLPELPPGSASSGDIIHLWAASATASSSYGESDWSADQALMAPDTTECGDKVTAWAPQSSNSQEWLELGYAVPINATEVVIYQTYNPIQITKVELIEPNGTAHQIYTDVPRDESGNCPYKTTISWNNPLNYPTEKVRITVDQSVLGLGWAEIDAVQLSGIQVENLYPDGSNSGSISGNDDFPVPPGAEIITKSKDTITLSTTMKLAELKEYYQEEFTKMGLTEDKQLTVEFTGGFSIVFEGTNTGNSVIQATETGDGKVIVVITHE